VEFCIVVLIIQDVVFWRFLSYLSLIQPGNDFVIYFKLIQKVHRQSLPIDIVVLISVVVAGYHTLSDQAHDKLSKQSGAKSTKGPT
jgi:hypothetical protein